jgi:AraC-like DNA-binding protein
LYDFCVADDTRMRAWRPEVPGVVEVLHARMTSHVYPMHTHESWTLLIVDDGMVRYDLHRRQHGALGRAVTLLPPSVPHNGRAATAAGFSKRVVYLDLSQVPDSLIGPAVGQPVLADPLLWQRIRQLHARFREKVTLRDASGVLHAHPAHLVRAFGREFGISPHQYVTSRRVDLARRLLLDGMPPSLAAAEAGFYDQAHLARHFRHVLGTSPGRYARSGQERQGPG